MYSGAFPPEPLKQIMKSGELLNEWIITLLCNSCFGANKVRGTHTMTACSVLIEHMVLQWRHNGHDCVSITSLTIVYSVYSGADQRKHQSSPSLALWVEFTGDRWIPHTGRVTWKMFPFEDVIMVSDRTHEISWFGSCENCTCIGTFVWYRQYPSHVVYSLYLENLERTLRIVYHCYRW